MIIFEKGVSVKTNETPLNLPLQGPFVTGFAKRGHIRAIINI